jgi:hypothetical protein
MRSQFKLDSNFAVLSCTWGCMAADNPVESPCDCSRWILTPSPHPLYRPRRWLLLLGDPAQHGLFAVEHLVPGKKVWDEIAACPQVYLGLAGESCPR